MNNVIVIITGPSGSGKSTLERALKNHGFMSLISTTTRPKRSEEVDGQHYYFTDKARFKTLLEEDAFVENVEFNDNNYGLLRNEVLKFKYLSTPAVIVVEPHGKQQIEDFAKSMGIDVLRVFVNVDSQTQMERLLTRYAQESNRAESGSRIEAIGKFKEVTKRFAERIVLATTLEKTWIADAYERISANRTTTSHSLPLKNYDMVFESYDDDTELNVLRAIDRRVNEILANQVLDAKKTASLEVA